MLTRLVLKRWKTITLISIIGVLFNTGIIFGLPAADSSKTWVGTWYTAPQLVEPGNMPPSPGLTNNSLRQVIRVSIGGDTIRFRFSNEFSNTPVTMKCVKVAVSAGGSTIYDSTTKKLTFNNSPDVKMDSGAAVISDPIAFNLTPRMTLAITIYFDTTSSTVTGHPGSRTTSYIIAGNDTSKNTFTGSVSTDHWYIIQGIDVLKPSTYSSVAIMGNSITDGRGTTTNGQNRWPDILSERLLANSGTEEVGILNAGIGANCMLKFCNGPAGIDRFKRDVLNQPGVKAAIIFHGVNDIGGVSKIDAVTTVANELIEAYKWMIDSAHARNIKIYGATIMPFKGHSYSNTYSEKCRNKVNNWIRNSGRYDGVIDFDKIMRNPNDTSSLGVPSFQSDGLHPEASGYKRMGDSINLKLFEGLDSFVYLPDTSGIEMLWIEPECSTVGENWKLVINPQNSNQGYVAVETGTSSISTAPDDSTSNIYIPFTVSKDTIYNIYARLNCVSSDNDSYWVKIDNGIYAKVDGFSTSGWEWKKLIYDTLSAGNHTLALAYCEEGTMIDKLCITNDTIVPLGLGKAADIMCLPDTAGPVSDIKQILSRSANHKLSQNYPNPFSDKTTIAFEIRSNSFVSLKVYTILGEEIAELAGKEFTPGMHTLEFKADGLLKGVYFYTIKTNEYSASRKMILQTK